MEVTPRDIAVAIAEDRLRFHFQPKVSFSTGWVSGAEALIRWVRDDGSVIQPDSFIPVAEGAMQGSPVLMASQSVNPNPSPIEGRTNACAS